eukprot:Rhum_TRINITY_DN5389_c0_g1::Rhum_TRINITY_DN5389_c0_g1_i1::g.17291::m.17291
MGCTSGKTAGVGQKTQQQQPCLKQGSTLPSDASNNSACDVDQRGEATRMVDELFATTTYGDDAGDSEGGVRCPSNSDVDSGVDETLRVVTVANPTPTRKQPRAQSQAPAPPAPPAPPAHPSKRRSGAVPPPPPPPLPVNGVFKPARKAAHPKATERKTTAQKPKQPQNGGMLPPSPSDLQNQLAKMKEKREKRGAGKRATH